MLVPTAADTSSIARTEREIVLEYEHSRREQILRFLLPAVILLGIIAELVLAVGYFFAPNESVRRSLLLILPLLAAALTLGLIGWVAYRRGRMTLASLLLLAMLGIGVAGSVPALAIEVGIDPLGLIAFTPFSAVIVLAGMIGDLWAIIIATLVMNVATAIFLIQLPGAAEMHALFARERTLLLPLMMVHQWLFAGLVLAIWLGYRRTLGAIGLSYERARQLDRLKDEFIANVNHELRTPIMAMQTYIEALRVAPERVPPAQLQMALDQAGDLSESLGELVRSILSTRRIEQEAETLKAETFHLLPVVQTAATLMDPREVGREQRDLVINVPSELVIRGDRIRTQQIVTNLLANAVKYSNSGTEVSISAKIVGLPGTDGFTMWRRRQPATPPMVEIQVKDAGHGIPPDQMPLLFNRFVRLPRDLASKVPGTGIGLYLCRVMSEAMGGRVWAESTGVEGEGSTFFVHLPFATASSLPQAASTVPLSR